LRDPGRVAASIEILRRFKERPLPINVMIQEWGRSARYAGSKDRAFVRGLCLDVLRHWKSSGAADDPRLGTYLILRDKWGWGDSRIEEAFAGEHGDGPLSDSERQATFGASLDLPDFLESQLGQNASRIAASMAERAPVDLRANTLKADQDKALKALKPLHAQAAELSPIGLRIPPPPSHDKGPGVTVIPAYGKGWVEVQDEGSQLTVLALGDLTGQQVLDYCAGGGGKTLALSASMGNSGQVYAYDADASRLAPIHERLRRAGARNVQVVAPTERERLNERRHSFDLVFVDAPCSGSGTWRRHPDTKWRLTESHLQARQSEQDQVLREAAEFVKPAGRLAFVTCSFLKEENEDRIDAFLAAHPEWTAEDPLGIVQGRLRDELEPFIEGLALRLSPWASGTDAFTMMSLRRKG
jgi:16S rRNA (cytosine967-C5)-methyltransferase